MAKRGKNEGSIWQKPNGVWVYQVTTSDGKRKAVTHPKRSECERLGKALAEAVRCDSVAYGLFLADWLELKQSLIKESTYCNYRASIYSHIMPHLGGVGITKLDTIVLQKFINGLNRSRNTKRICLYILRNSLELALQQQLIKVNPARFVKLPKEYDRKEKVCLTDRQIAEIMNSKHRHSNYWRVLLLTGMRVNELLALKPEDISSNEINVNKTKSRKNKITRPKTRSSIRKIPKPKGITIPTNSTVCDITISNEFKKIFGVSIHVLRHTFITKCVENNISIPTIMALVGHSNSKMILEVYSHSEKKLQTVAIECLVNSIESIGNDN